MVNFSSIPDTTGSGLTGQAQTAEKSATVGKDAFLQMLVAQIRNQNPLNPADGVEFLSQLAQFSQLEQTMSIREEISGLRQQVEAIATSITSQDKTQGAENV